MLAFLGWEWKSTTGRFAIGRFWPFTWKKSSVDFTTIVVFCNHGSVHFSILRVRANTLYDCYSGICDSFIFIENSRLFFPVRGLLCLYDKQNNTWLLVDMEFLFSCSTRHLTRSLRSLVSYRVKHSKRNSISTHAHVLFSIYLTWSVLYKITHKEIKILTNRKFVFLV